MTKETRRARPRQATNRGGRSGGALQHCVARVRSYNGAVLERCGTGAGVRPRPSRLAPGTPDEAQALGCPGKPFLGQCLVSWLGLDTTCVTCDVAAFSGFAIVAIKGASRKAASTSRTTSARAAPDDAVCPFGSRCSCFLTIKPFSARTGIEHASGRACNRSQGHIWVTSPHPLHAISSHLRLEATIRDTDLGSRQPSTPAPAIKNEGVAAKPREAATRSCHSSASPISFLAATRVISSRVEPSSTATASAFS